MAAKTQKNPADTQVRIIAVAKRLFVERGYSDVSMTDIAAAMGIQKASLYYHFKSKAHIFGAIIREMIMHTVPAVTADLRAALALPGDDLAAAERVLAAALEGFAAAAVEEGAIVGPKDLAVIKGHCELPPGVAELVGEVRQAFLDFFSHFDVAEPPLAQEIVMSATHAYIARRKHNLINVEPARFARYLARLIMRPAA
jgi:AcrR family transcriptional regulator